MQKPRVIRPHRTALVATLIVEDDVASRVLGTTDTGGAGGARSVPHSVGSTALAAGGYRAVAVMIEIVPSLPGQERIVCMAAASRLDLRSRRSVFDPNSYKMLSAFAAGIDNRVAMDSAPRGNVEKRASVGAGDFEYIASLQLRDPVLGADHGQRAE